MAISDRMSLVIMSALAVGSIGAILMTSNLRKIQNAQNKPYGLEGGDLEGKGRRS